MKKNVFLSTLLLGSMSLFFTGCDNKHETKFELSKNVDKTYLLNKDNGELFYVDNKTMYKVVTESETKNKIGEILNLEDTIEYTKISIKSKVYNDSLYYRLDLKYVPLITEVNDESNPSKKVKKDISKISFDEWRKIITNFDKNYSLTLVFLDQDNFTVTTKTILLKNLTVNFRDGVTYEGSFVIDKSIATKINKLHFYYYFPEFNTIN